MGSSTDRSIVVRPAEARDEVFLWECLALAAYEESAATARQVPYLQKWLDGWLKPTDFGVIALRNDRSVGGCWVRQFPDSDPDLPIYIDDKTPEIAIGVTASERGTGVGARLLEALCEEARRRRLNGLCLTVRSNNPAIGLYERMGFDYVAEAERINRIGGVSYGMVLKF